MYYIAFHKRPAYVLSHHITERETAMTEPDQTAPHAAPAAAPVVVIGAGPLGAAVAARLAIAGLRPVVVDAAPAAEIAAEIAAGGALVLSGRRATALWGTLEGGFNVETDTGETITGAAVVVAAPPADAHCARALGDAGLPKALITGLGPVAVGATGETAEPGVFIAAAGRAEIAADAAAARVVPTIPDPNAERAGLRPAA